MLSCDSEDVFLSVYASDSCSAASEYVTANLSYGGSCNEGMIMSCSTTGKRGIVCHAMSICTPFAYWQGWFDSREAMTLCVKCCCRPLQQKIPYSVCWFWVVHPVLLHNVEKMPHTACCNQPNKVHHGYML